MRITILDLENWYSRQCDGDWEHEFGIIIENIDNPGWKITIPLLRTDCETKEFNEIKIDKSDTDWVHCKKQDGKFLAWGGPKNLNELLEIFLSWCNSN